MPFHYRSHLPRHLGLAVFMEVVVVVDTPCMVPKSPSGMGDGSKCYESYYCHFAATRYYNTNHGVHGVNPCW